jgi:hypothetical protein
MLSRNSAFDFVFAIFSRSSSMASTGGHLLQHLAQHPGPVQLLVGEEQLLLAGARAQEVHGGEDAPVGELAVEVDLHVPRALELLEDDVVHAGAGVDERRGQDGERASLLHVAGGAEEALGLLQGVGVEPAGEHAPGGRAARRCRRGPGG